MKIFALSLLLLHLMLVRADVNLKSDYNYNGNNNNAFQTYYMPQQQQQQQQQSPQQVPQVQYPGQNLIPSTEYLVQQQHNKPKAELPLQLNPRYPATVMVQQQQLAPQYPMPSDFPSVFNYQTFDAKKSSYRYQFLNRLQKKPIITKHFFLHSAPEETQADIDEELAALQQQPRKHYNILFVKAPSQTSKVAALNLAKALREEKTVVYVLAKRTSAADLQDALQELPEHINKPEVFFIKYRTPEEAADVQRQIQFQYDTLGGTTIISDEGIAPTTSVIGSLAASEEKAEKQLQTQKQQQLQGKVQAAATFDAQQQSTNNGYLPPPNKY